MHNTRALTCDVKCLDYGLTDSLLRVECVTLTCLQNKRGNSAPTARRRYVDKVGTSQITGSIPVLVNHELDSE